MANLPQVTDNNFQAEVLDAGQPVLVDFWAPWCGPCRVVHPILEEMSGERDDVKIVSVNIDENQETAGKYQVMSIPTMIVFKGGQPAKTIVGAMPKKRLEKPRSSRHSGLTALTRAGAARPVRSLAVDEAGDAGPRPRRSPRRSAPT